MKNQILNLPEDLFQQITSYLNTNDCRSLSHADKALFRNPILHAQQKALEKNDQNDYEALDHRGTTLMDLFKKGDTNGIINANVTPEELLLIKDSNNRGLVDWAQQNHHQAAIDEYYRQASVSYTPQDQLFLALLCDQSDEIIASILQHDDIDLNIDLQYHVTALHLAAMRGRLAIAILILEDDRFDVELNQRTLQDTTSETTSIPLISLPRGATALFLAAHYGHLELVKYLSQRDEIDLNTTACFLSLVSKRSYRTMLTTLTPILAAAKQAHWDIVEYLLTQPTIDISKEISAREGPHFFRERNLDRDSDDDLRSSMNHRDCFFGEVDYKGLIYFAIHYNQLNIIKALIALDESILIRHTGHELPIEIAINAGHIELVKFIYEQLLHCNKVQFKDDDAELQEMLDEKKDNADEEEEKRDITEDNITMMRFRLICTAIKSDQLALFRFFYEDCGIQWSDRTKKFIACFCYYLGSETFMQYAYDHINKNADFMPFFELMKEPFSQENYDELMLILANENQWQKFEFFFHHNSYLILDHLSVSAKRAIFRIAATAGQVNILKFLIENQPDIDFFVSTSATSQEPEDSALALALFHEQRDAVKYLSAQPNALSSMANAPDAYKALLYHYAQTCKWENDIQHLYQADELIRLQSMIANGTTLVYAAKNKRWSLINTLAQLPGINLNATSEEENATTSYLAMAAKQYDLVEDLCLFGADLNRANQEGTTLLHLAIQQDNFKMFRYLHIHGANIHIIDSENGTLLHVAAEHKQLDIAKYCCEHRVNLNAKTTAGATALHIAVFSEQIELVRYLCRQPGIRLTDKMNHDSTVFSLAIEKDDARPNKSKCFLVSCLYGQAPIVFGYLDGHAHIKNKESFKLFQKTSVRYEAQQQSLSIELFLKSTVRTVLDQSELDADHPLAPINQYLQHWRSSHRLQFWRKEPGFNDWLMINMVVEYYRHRSYTELLTVLDRLISHPSVNDQNDFKSTLQAVRENLIATHLVVSNNLRS
jgi:ankyrin repeat protein